MFFRVVADVWEADVWEFQPKSGSSGSCCLFLQFLGKIVKIDVRQNHHRCKREVCSAQCRVVGLRLRCTFPSRSSFVTVMIVVIRCAMQAPDVDDSVSFFLEPQGMSKMCLVVEASSARMFHTPSRKYLSKRKDGQGCKPHTLM